MFKNCINSKRMGDIGEAKAIFEFIKAGYDVYKPISESVKTDLIVEINNILYKVQVKTTKSKSKSGNYVVQLRTTGKNSNTISIRNRENGDYDYLFVLTDSGNWYFIPEKELGTNCKTLNSSMNIYKNAV